MCRSLLSRSPTAPCCSRTGSASRPAASTAATATAWGRRYAEIMWSQARWCSAVTAACCVSTGLLARLGVFDMIMSTLGLDNIAVAFALGPLQLGSRRTLQLGLAFGLAEAGMMLLGSTLGQA